MKKILITLIIGLVALVSYSQTPSVLVKTEFNYNGRMMDSVYFKLHHLEPNYVSNKVYGYFDTYLHIDAYNSGAPSVTTCFEIDFTVRPSSVSLQDIYVALKNKIKDTYGLTNSDLEIGM